MEKQKRIIKFWGKYIDLDGVVAVGSLIICLDEENISMWVSAKVECKLMESPVIFRSCPLETEFENYSFPGHTTKILYRGFKMVDGSVRSTHFGNQVPEHDLKHDDYQNTLFFQNRKKEFDKFIEMWENWTEQNTEKKNEYLRDPFYEPI